MIVYLFENGDFGNVTDSRTIDWVCNNGFDCIQDMCFIYVGY